ncbi:FecCD family ABC transporter permease [Gordonia crocea]|uniref:Iron ABC transporter permease n=1 Tax=Gordonia crocea TaxID=589162 RepID=A0A7I9UWD6_9ACTN|nr:iron chelate uptake ABC transporter family permease subunit [Gordonia crocea]GED97253.1 iron ABC transporter permease [Gordonia crocea]
MTATAAAPVHAPRRRLGGGVLTACLVGSLVLLALLAWASLFVGARDVAPGTVWDVLLGRGTGFDALAVTDATDGRLPRALLAVLVGAALGVAGLLIQRLMNNPLGDPQILGVNSGAALAITIAIGLCGFTQVWAYVWFAFAGAAVAMVIVYALATAGRGPLTPLRITMAGIAVAAVLSGAVRGITLVWPHAFDQLRIWEVGSVTGRGVTVAAWVAPFIVVGIAVAFVIAHAVDVIGMGDEMATALGVRVGRIRVAALVVATVLAGAATAAAGPIGFVGLMVPHAIRLALGVTGRWAVAFAAVAGGLIVLGSDIVARLFDQDKMPVGIVTAFIGAPILILLIRNSAGTAR